MNLYNSFIHTQFMPNNTLERWLKSTCILASDAPVNAMHDVEML
jgi:hypothetical protein